MTIDIIYKMWSTTPVYHILLGTGRQLRLWEGCPKAAKIWSENRILKLINQATCDHKSLTSLQEWYFKLYNHVNQPPLISKLWYTRNGPLLFQLRASYFWTYYHQHINFEWLLIMSFSRILLHAVLTYSTTAFVFHCYIKGIYSYFKLM